MADIEAQEAQEAQAASRSTSGGKLKCLVVWFSRTGGVKRSAECAIELLKEKNDVTVVNLVDDGDKYSGMIGFVRGGMHAATKPEAQIATIPPMDEIKTDEFDRLVLAAPLWNGSLNPLLRTFCDKHKDALKKIPKYFVLSHSIKTEPTSYLASLEKILGAKPADTAHLIREIVKDFDSAGVPIIREFVAKVELD